MNFIEAIKSGKPLRRSGKSTWSSITATMFGPTYYNTLGNSYIQPDFLLNYIFLRKEDILAEDWEIKND